MTNWLSGDGRSAQGSFRRYRFRFGAGQVQDVAAGRMGEFIAIENEPLPVGKKAGPSALNVFEAADLDRLGLAGADRQQCNLLRVAVGDCDGPLSIRRKTAGAAFSETNRKRSVQLTQRHREPRSGGCAGVLKQHELSVAFDIFRDVPVVPG